MAPGLTTLRQPRANVRPEIGRGRCVRQRLRVRDHLAQLAERRVAVPARREMCLEAHLATCGHCYATLSELRQVVAHAKALPDTPPATDLWPNIRARLTQGSETRRHAPGSRRFSFTVPQLLAASIALML